MKADNVEKSEGVEEWVKIEDGDIKFTYTAYATGNYPSGISFMDTKSFDEFKLSFDNSEESERLFWDNE